MPIVDSVLRERAANGGERTPGVKAIVVYPMNALANSQMYELKKFLEFGYPAGGEPVRFARYTGQENEETRRQILADPPDILLTNYVMLELVLTRPDKQQHLIRAAQDLRFLVLDVSLTPIADGREPTWLCWSDVCGTSAPPIGSR